LNRDARCDTVDTYPIIADPGGNAVRDLIFVAVMVAFFAVSVGLVRLCERIAGGAEVVAVDMPTTTEPTDAAA
jgi:hypothetical protein